MDDLSHEEREYLRKLVSAAHKELLHELHHAAKLEFKEKLKKELELNEKVFAKLEPVLVSRA
jgi:hypothetical protein